MRRRPWGHLAAVVATAVLLVGGATASRASWDATTATGSSSSVSAATIPSVGTVTATRQGLGLGMSVTWNAVTVAGVPVRGYEVVRYRTTTGGPTLDPTAGGCTGVLSAPTCTDSGSLLGLGGLLTYVVTPLFATNWRGAPVTSNTA